MDVSNQRQTKETEVVIYSLGGFSVQCGNSNLPLDNKGLNKAWELFQFLLFYRGKRFFPEEILETLWPEQEYADPKAIFRYYVHKIRQELAQNPETEKTFNIVSSNGSYFLETNGDYWWDVLEFENLSKKAGKYFYSNYSEAIEMLYSAINLYKGEYLPELSSSWVIPLRSYFRYMYLENLFELIELLKMERKYFEIIKLCRKALVVEPFEEKLHYYYLEALLEENKTAQARTHYEFITSAMYHEIGAKPSRALQKLYQSIKEDESNNRMDLTSIKEMLRQPLQAEGAMLCEPEIFRFFFERERRRVEKENINIHIGLFTLTSPDLREASAEKLKQAMEELKNVLLTSLCKSDVFSRWNEAQYALLLSGFTLQEAEEVLQRINNHYQKVCSHKDIVLLTSTHSLFNPDKLEYSTTITTPVQHPYNVK